MATTTNEHAPPYAVSLAEILKLIGGFGAICYAAGFIIASINSQEYAFGGLTLLSVRYVSVGLCFFLLLALSMLSTYYSGRFVLVLKGRFFPRFPVFEKVCAMLLLFVLVVLVSVAVIAILSTGTVWEPGTLQVMKLAGNRIRSQTISFIVGWHLFLIAAALILSALTNRKPSTATRFAIPADVWLIPVMALLLISATKTYASVIYPNINPAFGGGQLLPVKLLISQSKIDEVDQLLPMEADPTTKRKLPWSKAVYLIDQNEKVYYVLIQNDQCELHGIQINKELVNGVIAAPSPSDCRSR